MATANRVVCLSNKFCAGAVRTDSNETLAIKPLKSVEDHKVYLIIPFCRGERVFTQESCSDIVLSYLERDIVLTDESISVLE